MCWKVISIPLVCNIFILFTTLKWKLNKLLIVDKEFSSKSTIFFKHYSWFRKKLSFYIHLLCVISTIPDLHSFCGVRFWDYLQFFAHLVNVISGFWYLCDLHHLMILIIQLWLVLLILLLQYVLPHFINFTM